VRRRVLPELIAHDQVVDLEDLSRDPEWQVRVV